MISKLFSPLTLGGKNPIQLQHRIAMAPLTRLRAGDSAVPPAFVAEYYAQRATPGGLIIVEATDVSLSARGFFGAPGIFNQEQIDAWKVVTEAVHAKGGIIFLQIWHTGRYSHPSLQPENVQPISSSSNMPLDDTRVVPTQDGPKPLEIPRALETDEIPLIVEDFSKAADNAIAAGFDGVEIHAANGLLLEQFLFDGINERVDKYGGSIENRSRIVFEILDAILETIDSSKVGVRFSPFNITCTQRDSDPATHYKYIFEKLNEYDLAYAHVIEPRVPHYPNEMAPEEGATAYFRKIYKGVLVTASGYDRQSALDTVEACHADIVAIGRYFISNPDLVKRFKLGAPLAAWNDSTFYTPGEAGCTDYPFLDEEEIKSAP
ncbi:hypothetical protein Poli38472_000074 [Pythium oligandrum]|uniref:NADH:flavin oxidoreductase/NADH oxidase N-terminal domain-containing protein n=1 Tax=Pythium oligandrum TaxID=41045 RepID=A0A8K1FHR7_PYTOL|nr:hypothetical protein Poli38472_000074 [Pythium oligandrum]|eukprot:TMW60032.1 hypothetical protein Poli38472_000074 [Pythium oligandrum]